MNSKIAQSFLILIFFVHTQCVYASQPSEQNQEHEFLKMQTEAADKFEWQRYHTSPHGSQRIHNGASNYFSTQQSCCRSERIEGGSSLREDNLFPRDSFELAKKKNTTLLQHVSNALKSIVNGVEKEL